MHCLTKITKFYYINHRFGYLFWSAFFCSFVGPYNFFWHNAPRLSTLTRSNHATEDNVQEAIRLFTVSTMDAAKSGINQQINLSPEMAREIQVCRVMSSFLFFLPYRFHMLISYLLIWAASRSSDKEKNRDWEPHIRKTTDWWSRQNGDEWIYCKYYLAT